MPPAGVGTGTSGASATSGTSATGRPRALADGCRHRMSARIGPRFTDDHLRYIKYLGLGGSTVPAAVTRRLADLGIVVHRSYGSSEHPSITGSHWTAPEDKRLFTDGEARPGVEIRLADDGETQLPIVKSEREKMGRNEPCWCGSGKKFKFCHGAN